VTEDLTTDLSCIADMFVIRAGTAFAYRNRAIDTKQIGRELGVRYVLEGSIERSGTRVRVNPQLIDDLYGPVRLSDSDTAKPVSVAMAVSPLPSNAT
jgi:TolB-like protein